VVPTLGVHFARYKEHIQMHRMLEPASYVRIFHCCMMVTNLHISYEAIFLFFLTVKEATVNSYKTVKLSVALLSDLEISET
jgi:hypothetical protein